MSVKVKVIALDEAELSRVEMRDAHAVWCELLLDVRRAASSLFALGHVAHAQALMRMTRSIDITARLHLRRLKKELAELKEDKAA